MINHFSLKKIRNEFSLKKNDLSLMKNTSIFL